MLKIRVLSFSALLSGPHSLEDVVDGLPKSADQLEVSLCTVRLQGAIGHMEENRNDSIQSGLERRETLSLLLLERLLTDAELALSNSVLLTTDLEATCVRMLVIFLPLPRIRDDWTCHTLASSPSTGFLGRLRRPGLVSEVLCG